MEDKKCILQKVLLILLAVLTLISGIFVFLARRQPVVEFRDGFLKQTVLENQTTYSGRCEGKELTVTLVPEEGSTAVEFRTEDGWTRSYVVREVDHVDFPENADIPESDILVQIEDKTGNVLFRGGFFSGTGLAIDENGEWDFGIAVTYVSANHDAWADYEPSHTAILRLALETDVQTRGSWGLYFLVTLLTLLVAFDVAFPKVLFYLHHMWSVRDPEPTEFYFVMQKLGWFVLLGVLIYGYWTAATIVG